MTKRRLNRRQQWRIQKIQDERAQRADHRSQQAEQSLQSGELGPEQKGLVIAHFGTQVEVEAIDHHGAENELDDKRDPTQQIQRCHFRTNLEALVTGDEVIWRPGSPTGVIVANQPRRSVLQRPDSYGLLKPVASNIDQIIIVICTQPVAHANLVDRYLVAAEHIGITPIILLNKTDLLNEDNRPDIEELLSIYPRLGYQVVYASTVNEEGLDDLRLCLQGHTSVFVGQSGVGKSSLIQALLPQESLRIGELSAARGKGRHTTTTARLYHFPAGGNLIDSPGIREFGLWHIEREQLLESFVEFRPFLGHCKFRDCQHEKEPGCALLRAVEEGLVSQRRLASFRIIDATANGVTYN